MVDDGCQGHRAPDTGRHLEGIERQVRPERPRCLPADQEAGTGVHDEDDVHPPATSLHVRQIGDPPAIWGPGPELARDQVPRPVACVVADRRTDAWLAADYARSPSSRMSRSAVQRATAMPSRLSCGHTFSAPYTCRCSSQTRRTATFSLPSPGRRADGGRGVAA
jgi:hypothetical protein